MIKLIPVGGLCNRMRVMASAYALSKKTNKELSVYWFINNAMCVPYNDLFVKNKYFRVRSICSNGSTRDKIISRLHFGSTQSRRYRWIKYYRKLFFNFDLTLKTEDLPPGKYGDRSLENLIRDKRSVLLKTWNQFYKADDLNWSIFKPVPELSAIIDEVVSNFTKNTIGVHVRRTDNVNAIKHSPLESFIKAMKSEVIINPAAKFYLATDCRETEKALQDLFQDRIILREKNLIRASKEGMRNALIDLYSLSCTNKILGSYWSSFSETAAELRGGNKITIKNDDLQN